MKPKRLSERVADWVVGYYLLWGLFVLSGSDSLEDLREADMYVSLGHWHYAPYVFLVAAWTVRAWPAAGGKQNHLWHAGLMLELAAIGATLAIIFLVHASA